MTAATSSGDTREHRVLFEAILYPQRSLGRRGLTWLMGVVISANLLVAGSSLALGAWPVIPFCGLEVVILYTALRLNTRSARLQERVCLTDHSLTVERMAYRQPTRRWSLPPNWLRVGLVNPASHSSPLMLSSHGQSVTIGAFLTRQEKQDFACALEDALRRWRNGDLSEPVHHPDTAKRD